MHSYSLYKVNHFVPFLNADPSFCLTQPSNYLPSSEIREKFHNYMFLVKTVSVKKKKKSKKSNSTPANEFMIASIIAPLPQY